ncbi:spore coat associated protein CotJA [Tepidibacillus fermentans]|uniref:spore coat associated protein CotJA n=1 Tax=Tepidibacillus fermentans TaxID=1281767 RepID=UPI001048E6F4
MLRRRPYPPIPIPPVKRIPLPPQDYTKQFPLDKALMKGTLFKWLYDPYVKRFF